MLSHMRPALVIAALAAVLLVSGCGGDSAPSGTPSVRGVVTEIQESGDGGSLRVVWAEHPAVGAQAEFDAAQVTVTEETEIRQRPQGSRQATPITFGEIMQGDIVWVWFTDGPVLESYPVQAGAQWIEVRGRYQGELPTPPGLEAPTQP
ncbi:MAG TPA: hypothetical protein VLA05_01130 [Coriobacteriia bacterium]|nr:hypothetical protein [Coriobacteriia bacterium]